MNIKNIDKIKLFSKNTVFFANDIAYRTLEEALSAGSINIIIVNPEAPVYYNSDLSKTKIKNMHELARYAYMRWITLSNDRTSILFEDFELQISEEDSRFFSIDYDFLYTTSNFDFGDTIIYNDRNYIICRPILIGNPTLYPNTKKEYLDMYVSSYNDETYAAWMCDDRNGATVIPTSLIKRAE